jgi:hypothetical protein
VAKVRHGLVVFGSPGGATIAALQMGQNIRLHRFATFVAPGSFCASACALAWLAGMPRVMQENSRIGFHAAFTEKNGEKRESGLGNALVGAYLSNLGLSYDAIYYLEKAAPDDITWLTFADANRLGIEVKLVTLSEPNSAPDTKSPRHRGAEPNVSAPPAAPVLPEPESPPQQPAASLADQAAGFVKMYFAHWSESGTTALEFFAGAYASQVMFYGQNIDHEAVLAGKQNYVARWPLRVYSARPDTMHEFCNEANRTCTVTGIVDWDCRNPAHSETTQGSANFSLTVSLLSKRAEIVAENGSVITRSKN